MILYPLLITKLFAKPNVLYVMVDDWGWGDWGIHGSRLDTPNLDDLAHNGIILDSYYTQPVCSPTRSSLLTGRHPIELGLQHGVILAGQDSGIPRKYRLLPQILRDCGYSTHLVGKWHCGHGHDWMRPENRGFDTFYGYLQGAEDHYTRLQYQNSEWFGVDFTDSNAPTNNTWGHYGADLYSSRVKSILNAHNDENPFFLYYAMQNVHYPLQAPEHFQTKYDWIENYNRRNYAAMLSATDEAIGDLVKLLKDKDVWKNTLMVVTADNGGETRSGGNNYPLRSQKFSLYEGGVRGNSFITGGLVDGKPGRRYDDIFHVSDWFETILDVTSCKQEKQKFSNLGSISHWKALDQSQGSKPVRDIILHNIDPMHIAKGAETRQWVNELAQTYNYNIKFQSAVRFGKWKLLTGNPAWNAPDGNIEPPEKFGSRLQFAPENRPYWVTLMEDIEMQPAAKLDRMVQLYQIDIDEGERNECSDLHPSVVEMGIQLLAMYNNQSITPQNPRIDPKSNPATRTDRYAGFWWPWHFE